MPSGGRKVSNVLDLESTSTAAFLEGCREGQLQDPHHLLGGGSVSGEIVGQNGRKPSGSISTLTLAQFKWACAKLSVSAAEWQRLDGSRRLGPAVYFEKVSTSLPEAKPYVNKRLLGPTSAIARDPILLRNRD